MVYIIWGYNLLVLHTNLMYLFRLHIINFKTILLKFKYLNFSKGI